MPVNELVQLGRWSIRIGDVSGPTCVRSVIVDPMAAIGVTIDHRVMGGVPCVAGTRIPVATVVGLLGQGQTIDEILAEYPTLTHDGILAALRYAAHAVDERELPLRLTA